MGTDQIGRFDIEVADSDNSIINWKWDLVPITDATAEPDRYLEQFINGYKTDVDKKYNAVVTRFSRKLTHPLREEESTLGNLIADALADVSETEVILIGSGSIRKQAMGPVVTLGSLQECFPFEDSLTKYQINGAQLSKIFAHIMRFENRNGEGECFQINERVKGVYSDPLAKLISLTVDDVPVNAAKKYTITLQNYHVINSEMNLGISNEELLAMGMPKVVTTSTFQVLEEWLRHHPNQKSNIEGRLVYEA